MTTKPTTLIRRTYPHDPPDLPDWLSSDDPVKRKNSVTVSHPSTQTTAPVATSADFVFNTLFPTMFEGVLVKIAEGQALKAILRDDFRQPEYEYFLRWVMSDPQRKERYYEAQAMGAEVIASEMIEIADADDTIEDVARSTLRINTRKWVLGVWNRKRFGETKQIDHNVTVDLSEAMSEARRRSGITMSDDVTDIEMRQISE